MDPIGRIEYAVTVNILIGIIFAFIMLRSSIRANFVTNKQLGFQSSLVYLKIAERDKNLVWKEGAKPRADWVSIRRKVTSTSTISLIVGGMVSIALFGVYHFAHSPPFNQPNMVLFLMIPAILTSVFYFIGREIYSTIIIHNFLALIGISGSIDITALTQPLYPVMIIAFISVIVLIVSDLFLIRRSRMEYQRQHNHRTKYED